MTMPLLTTKLYIPPARPGLVSRQRLLAQLDEGLARKLTLVCAPAGFGKTTLVSEWLHTLGARQTPPQRVAWLSLDEGDNDPVRFWRYVVAALQTVDDSLGKAAQAALELPQPSLLESPQPPSFEAFVTALINTVAALPLDNHTSGSAIVLVLDDYHAIEAEPIHHSLDFLLDHLPPQLHLVIASRADPPLSLPRRRARAELAEVRTADLRFTADEAAEFLNTSMGLDLSAEDIVALESRTEGWIVGLQMAALSLQGQADKHGLVAAFAGDDRYVADYLVEEVLRRQPDHVQAFLLRTSPLERLSGPLCDAVVGQVDNLPHDSQAILEELEQANLFIEPLDNRRHWYRYNHLFAELLRERLHRVSPEEEVKGLHLRASAWYERKGFVAEAISHALAASADEHAAALLEQHAMTMVYRGETALTRSWLEALPESLVRSRPMLCVAYGWALSIAPIPSLDLAEQWLQSAESMLGNRERERSGVAEPYRTIEEPATAYAAALPAYLALDNLHDPQATVARSLQALDRIPEDNLKARSILLFVLGQAYLALGNRDAADRALVEARRMGETGDSPFIAFGAMYLQASVAREQGRLHKVAATCQGALRTAVEPVEQVGLSLARAAHVLLGSILLEWNDLEGAARALSAGLEQGERADHMAIQIERYIWRVRLKRALGDIPGALDLIEQATQAQPIATVYFAALRAQTWLAQTETDPSRLADVAHWAQECESTLDKENLIPSIIPLFNRDVQRLTLARLLIAQRRLSASGQPDLQPLMHYLDDQLQQAEEAGWATRAIEVLILQALAHQAQGATGQALSALERALSLAEPEGYVRIFLDEGAPMARLLYKAVEYGITPGYASRLLAALEVAEEGLSSTPPQARASALIEPLSEREIEILGLIAQGLTNREIARQLVLSPGTVKVHTNHTYGRLDAHNRTQAVAKARALGILA
jgi:LuxR family maltose regulon positive regulatory protein